MISVENLTKLGELSALNCNTPMYKRIIKLQEEVGELSQEFLAYDDKNLGTKTNASKSAKGTIESVVEETCDVINVAIDILNSIELNHQELSTYIDKVFREKLDKWETKITTSDIYAKLQAAQSKVVEKHVDQHMERIITEDMAMMIVTQA